MKTRVIRLMVALLVTMMASASAMASDLSAFDLKGRVKSVTYYNWSAPYTWFPWDENGQITYSFDTAGNVIVPQNMRVIRNSMGVAVDFQFYNCYWFSQKLTYNSNGKLKKVESGDEEHVWHWEYFYDSNGRVCKKVLTAFGEDGEGGFSSSKTTTYYEYVSFDAKGNWTERIAKEPGNVRTETRKIVYYQ